MNAFFQKGLLPVLAALTLGACAAADRPGADATNDARFDWFVYEGRDAVYEQTPPGPGTYANPILAGFYPDPSITRAGDDYYLVTSSFSYFPGVPIFRSRDLVNWTQIGHVLDRPSQLSIDSLGISRGVFAPTIRHHEGTFYMITTLVDAGGNFLVTATDPAGPWSDPVWLPFDGIDPDVFFDDDGKVYISNNGPPEGEPRYDGHRALWLQEYDPAAQQLIGPRRLIVDGGVDISKQPIWIEAPHLFKIDDTYYLIAAEGGTGDQHSQVVFRSDSVWGPYVPYEGNPILTQRHLDPARPSPVTSAGHADFVQLPGGEWWAVFLATRPYEGDFYNTGRETFLLPVRWVDGWPVVLAGEETVPYVHPRPDLPAQPAPPVPTSGNFTHREDFDGAELAPYWTFIRTPRERWYDLTTEPGWLTIAARPVALDAFAQPSFVGRRQQHARFTASTAMRFDPSQPGDRAGLAAFQNDRYHYFLGVALEDGAPVVRVEQQAGEGPATVLASAPIELAAEAPVYLKIEADGDAYDFYYGLAPDAWTLLVDDADGKILSTRVAGGFVGAMIGMYAYGERP